MTRSFAVFDTVMFIGLSSHTSCIARGASVGHLIALLPPSQAQMRMPQPARSKQLLSY